MSIDEDTIAQLVETVRRYTREKLVPLEEKVVEEDRVPDEIIQDFRDMGLFGLTTPEEFGGLGLTAWQEAQILTELTWAAPAFRSLVGINLGLGSQSILKDGTDAQREEWLPRVASGEIITSFCLTEPHSGSDAAALTTSAVRDGDEYVLNGSKRYITNGPIAGLFIVMARTVPERLPKNAHVTAFLVPGDTPGIERGKKDRKMGQSGAWSCDIHLDNVRVPASAILGGEEGKGFRTAMSSLDRGRISVSAACVGTARRALHEAVLYASERTQFGQAIGNFQLIQAMLADSQADLYAAECMLRDVAQRFDQGHRVSLEASCTKMFCSEMVGRVADRAVQIHGGAGYMRDSAVERIYRDARVFRIYEGTTQIQQTIIGKELMKRATA
ncbi:acyl-CoA dehydrogenase family protein [Novosphingobium pentaromativorans]|uniref:Acyl-CoA dehydrogenase n=1 Tax=Novosphingobium pentaromativorans US6-1 TaxID=1088721 RepID=G6ED72_9SPHN|nr:acyl-CoA dehydrogenase family protein [Novosphingobium pentaromativorans]AIT79834.1 acyl-CoA dehydrogenase [Novosphingobium pentaromativorans US6-1]EHJ60784.1 Acyl-CoA dehydrogenase [Novosphingobium pentaromativorans US6-1]